MTGNTWKQSIGSKVAAAVGVIKLRPDTTQRLKRILKDDWKARYGLTGVIVLLGVAVFAPVLVPHDPQSIAFQPLQSPGLVGVSDHPMGTDSLGRDMLSRLILGARVSLAVAVAAVLVGGVAGTVVGLIAGFFGGRTDDVLMRAVDVVWAFPFLIIAILLVAIFGQSFWNVIIALGVAYVDDFARVARSEVLSIREEEYILSARVVGMSDTSIIFGEVFPNIIAPMIVMFTVLVPRAILGEASLSFLGLGVQPTTPTWGAMMGQGRDYVTSAWWIPILPGVLVMITVLCINFFGDALRDTFDVRRTRGDND